MKNNISNYYQNIISYDLLTKNHFQNVFQLPKIHQISLNIGFKNANIEKNKLVNILVFLKLLSNQKPIETKSRKNNIFFKIKKNSIIGCKITLKGKNAYSLIEQFILFILPQENYALIINKEKTNGVFDFQIKNIFNFLAFKKELFQFKDIPPMDVSIEVNKTNSKEFFMLLNALYLIK